MDTMQPPFGEDPSGPSIWASQTSAAAAGEPTPLPVAPAPVSPVVEVTTGSVPLALLAGAAVALAGGLVWAGVVIATRFDIGFLAWFVGAATGLAIVRVAGGPVGPAARALAGLLAAGGIMVGKYVIFVHDVKDVLGAQLAAEGVSVGYLDSRQMSIFVHHFGSIVRPIYGLWAILALVAAVRAAGGRTIVPGRRRRT